MVSLRDIKTREIMNMRLYFIILITAAAAFAAGVRTGRHGNEPSSSVNVVTDTVWLTDTLRVEIPVPVERRSVRTVTIRDTVTLPATVRVYEDSAFRAVVSGIDPRLDSLTLYPTLPVVRQTMTRTIVPAKRRWGLGVTAGVALTPRGLSPAISAGVCYTIISW